MYNNLTLIQEKLLNHSLDINGIQNFINNHFNAGTYFVTQLMMDEINILDRLFEQRNGLFEQQIKHLVVRTSLSAAQLRQVLVMLQHHNYIQLQESIPTITGSRVDTRFKIIDNPYCSSKIASIQEWKQAEGFVFEDVVRSLLTKHNV